MVLFFPFSSHALWTCLSGNSTFFLYNRTLLVGEKLKNKTIPLLSIYFLFIIYFFSSVHEHSITTLADYVHQVSKQFSSVIENNGSWTSKEKWQFNALDSSLWRRSSKWTKNINSPSKIIKRIIDTPSSHIHKKTDMLNLKKNIYVSIYKTCDTLRLSQSLSFLKKSSCQHLQTVWASSDSYTFFPLNLSLESPNFQNWLTYPSRATFVRACACVWYKIPYLKAGWIYL